MSERDTDLKSREEGAEAAALRDTYGAPRKWGSSVGTIPPALATVTQPPGSQIVPGRGKSEPGKVVSTWAVRPVNSRDYTAIFQRWVSNSSGFVFDNTLGSCFYRVPGGYVATVERFTYYAAASALDVFERSSLIFGQASGSIFLELYFNGAPQGLYERNTPSSFADWITPSEFGTSIRLPSVGIDEQCFFLAPPDTLIELRFMLGFGLGQNASAGMVRFGGTLRETRGLPSNYEVQS